jgi:hypothetical protein
MAFLKIRINNSDVYGIEVPIENELTLDQFSGLVEKLIIMRKNLSKGYNKVQDKSFVSSIIETKTENKIEKKLISDRYNENIILEPPPIDSVNEGELYEEMGLFSKPLMLKLLKIYWNHPLEESERRLQEIIKDYNLPISSREDIRLMVFRAINKWKIVPEELNLRRFPTPGDDNIKDLMINHE